MPLLRELSRTSQDSFESDSDSKESQDDRLSSFKSGVLLFLHFFDSIDSIFISIRSILRPRVVVDRPDRPRYSKRTENFKRPKNRKDSSDLDENLTESIAALKTLI